MRVFGFIRFLAPLLVLLLGYQVVLATDFTVSNNLDSGTGSFRQALQDAIDNGAPTDRIIFAIPGTSTSQHTITLQSALPLLSSYLTIDGTTQSGDSFPVGDAKIRILLPPANVITCLQGTKITDIAIYGLCIDKPVLLPGDPITYTGILLESTKNIKIGAIRKGNFIGNVNNAILVTYKFEQAGDLDNPALLCENVEIKSNIVGLSADGSTKCDLGSSSIRCQYVKNLTIGGSSAAEGNIVMGQIRCIEVKSNAELPTGKLTITWNQVGLDYEGGSALLAIPFTSPESGIGVQVESFYLAECEIANNTIAGLSAGIQLSVNCFFKIRANKIGTDFSGLNTIGIAHSAIVLSNCKKGGIIGGHLPADKNLIQGAFLHQYPGYKDVGVIENINSPSVELTGNVFKCDYNSYTYSVKPSSVAVLITERAPGSITGTATANSKVHLYYSLSAACTSCEPEQLFDSINVDNAGNWKYLGNSQDKNIIASTRFAGQTSEFTSIRADFTPSDVKIQMVCDDKKGSISGLKYKNASFYRWYNSRAEIIASTSNVSELDVGFYYLEVSDGFCSTRSDTYEITDESVKINGLGSIQSANCGVANGSITGITANAGIAFIWTKGGPNGTKVGDTPDLLNMLAGNYTLTVSNANCSKGYSFTIPVVADPVVSMEFIQVSNTTCDNIDGSIKGLSISGSGPYSFSWKNQQSQQVGTAIDLVNVPAGRYILDITGGTICGTLSTVEFQIIRNGSLTLSETRVLSLPSCNGSSGSISGIQVTGATTYTWLDQAGNMVSTSNNSADLRNFRAGTFKLQASNTFCMKESKFYTILSPLAADLNAIVIIPDQCRSGKGSISNIQVSGGLAPYSYIWKDAAGKTVGTQANLSNVKAGTYSLQIVDVYGGTCSDLNYTFDIPDQTVQLASPTIPDVTVCAPGEAVILVDNPLTGTYSLFDDASAGTPLALSSNGVFTILVAAETEYYISFTSGSCNSAKVPFKVFVSDEGFKVSGSFTPNGDGINDTWRIFNSENYPRADIRLYNRTGQMVFKSIGYSTPFDGKRNGSNLPEGTYYYLIDLRSGCKTLSGSLTIIR